MKDLYNSAILVVDDDNFFRRLMKTSLEGLGIQKIGEASSGLTAIDYLAHHPCDLLIVDVQMPDINGIELLQKIRAGETASPHTTPVIILTSSSETAVLKKVVELDVSGFMAKPTTPGIMKNKILAALKGSSHIKSESVYSAISTTLPGITTSPEPTTSPKPKPESESTSSPEKVVTGSSQIPLTKLLPGAVIGDSIYALDGRILLTIGTVLTDNNIRRLNDLKRKGALQSNMVWIVD